MKTGLHSSFFSVSRSVSSLSWLIIRQLFIAIFNLSVSYRTGYRFEFRGNMTSVAVIVTVRDNNAV